MAMGLELAVRKGLSPTQEARVRALLAEVGRAPGPPREFPHETPENRSHERRPRGRRSRTGHSSTRPSLAHIELVPRRSLHPGTVVIADIPFADNEGCKTRPAVVLEVGRRSIDVLPVTTKGRMARRRGYVPILKFVAAGLNRPSWIVPCRVQLDRAALRAIKGHLAPSDAQALVAAVHLGATL